MFFLNWYRYSGQVQPPCAAVLLVQINKQMVPTGTSAELIKTYIYINI